MYPVDFAVILDGYIINVYMFDYIFIRGRTGLVVRVSDSGSGDPGSILSRVGVLFP